MHYPAAAYLARWRLCMGPLLNCPPQINLLLIWQSGPCSPQSEQHWPAHPPSLSAAQANAKSALRTSHTVQTHVCTCVAPESVTPVLSVWEYAGAVMKRQKEALRQLLGSIRPARGPISTWAMCSLPFSSMLQQRRPSTLRSRHASASDACGAHFVGYSARST